MGRYGRAVLQRRRSLNVEATDMEEGQHGQHVIVGGKTVHVLTHYSVPQQRFLPQHRTLGPAGGARGIDDQEWTREIAVRIAAVATRVSEKAIECAACRRRKV